ncbi:MAG: hypothetical protein LBV45_01815 [Xanthomonadaceae bacterium]|nr:hypothetical protein [Xanthomonadaceae bacterium]
MAYGAMQVERAVTQDGCPLWRYKRRWKIERPFAWPKTFNRVTICRGQCHEHSTAFMHLALSVFLRRHTAVFMKRVLLAVD